MPGSCWTRSRCECGYHVDLLFYDDDYVKLEQDKLSDKKTCRCGAIFEIWERKEDHEPFVRCRFKDSPDYEKLIRIEKKNHYYYFITENQLSSLHKIHSHN